MTLFVSCTSCDGRMFLCIHIVRIFDISLHSYWLWLWEWCERYHCQQQSPLLPFFERFSCEFMFIFVTATLGLWNRTSQPKLWFAAWESFAFGYMWQIGLFSSLTWIVLQLVSRAALPIHAMLTGYAVCCINLPGFMGGINCSFSPSLFHEHGDTFANVFLKIMLGSRFWWLWFSWFLAAIWCVHFCSQKYCHP